jgi:hypothetical protein
MLDCMVGDILLDDKISTSPLLGTEIERKTNVLFI